jgi:hypothetical protein
VWSAVLIALCNSVSSAQCTSIILIYL